jgi:hypothetical protein
MHRSLARAAYSCVLVRDVYGVLMKYNFSSQFMKILPPDTNFGEAWESLCYLLLCEEKGYDGFVRLNPPDRGIDIFHRRQQRAYQCKSHENGAFATLDPIESINSLTMALRHKGIFDWQPYCFATNANYSGVGFEKILKHAEELGINKNMVEHLGPEYWDNLCDTFPDKVKSRFDYRIIATEEQVVDAFKKARYFDKYIKEYQNKINNANFNLILTNNRTPVEIEIPFSPELSVENYLDVAKNLLGISLDWTNFHDLNTSAGPSLSITIEQYAQPFSKTIGELDLTPGDKLQLWIKIVWRDQPKNDGKSMDSELTKYKKRYCLLDRAYYRELKVTDDLFKLWDKDLALKIKHPEDRRTATIARKEEIIQSTIWKGVEKLTDYHSKDSRTNG